MYGESFRRYVRNEVEFSLPLLFRRPPPPLPRFLPLHFINLYVCVCVCVIQKDQALLEITASLRELSKLNGVSNVQTAFTHDSLGL